MTWTQSHLEVYMSCPCFLTSVNIWCWVLACRVCHIVVGTSGRVCTLLERNDLVTNSIRLLVLAEASILLDDSNRQDILWLFLSLPRPRVRFFYPQSNYILSSNRLSQSANIPNGQSLFADFGLHKWIDSSKAYQSSITVRGNGFFKHYGPGH